MKTKHSILLLPCVALLSACTVAGTKSGENAQEGMSPEEVKQEVRENVYPMPTAFEVTEMIQRMDASFILDICNPVENAPKYLTEPKRALNMGIYSADLSYVTTYNQQQQVADYMQVMRTLFDALDMTAAVDMDLPQKLTDAANDKEKMTDLISNAFYDSYDYLYRNNREPVAVLNLIGVWVESLYITTHIAEDTFENKEMIKVIMNQKDSLGQLYSILDRNVTDNDNRPNNAIADMRQGLAPVRAIYDKCDQGSITVDQMKQIKTAIEPLRASIVGVQ